MRVGIIGGTEKSLTRYEEVAAAVGCRVEFHDGKMAGRGTEALDSMVARCDLIVIITQINSHAAVRRAQKFCRRHRRPVRIVRRFGLHSFGEIVGANVSRLLEVPASCLEAAFDHQAH